MDIDNQRPSVSSAASNSSSTAGPKETGLASGNFTLPTDEGNSGSEGDDERSSGGGGDGTLYADASKGDLDEGGTDGEETVEGKNEENAQGMRDLGLDEGDMTYQCDDSLGGGPDPIDCEKLAWSGLRSPDNIATLQPNVPQFFTQGISSPTIVHHIEPGSIEAKLMGHFLQGHAVLPFLHSLPQQFCGHTFSRPSRRSTCSACRTPSPKLKVVALTMANSMSVRGSTVRLERREIRVRRR